MILGKVVGSLWGAKQSDGLGGRRLVQVRPVKTMGLRPGERLDSDPPEEALSEGVIVAVDPLGADEGQLVVVSIGSRVRDITVGSSVPAKAVVVGIVDSVWREA